MCTQQKLCFTTSHFSMAPHLCNVIAYSTWSTRKHLHLWRYFPQETSSKSVARLSWAYPQKLGIKSHSFQPYPSQSRRILPPSWMLLLPWKATQEYSTVKHHFTARKAKPKKKKKKKKQNFRGFLLNCATPLGLLHQKLIVLLTCGCRSSRPHSLKLWDLEPNKIFTLLLHPLKLTRRANSGIQWIRESSMKKLAIGAIFTKASRKVKARLVSKSRGSFFTPKTNITRRETPPVQMWVPGVPILSPNTQFKAWIDQIFVLGRVIEEGKVLIHLLLVDKVTVTVDTRRESSEVIVGE